MQTKSLLIDGELVTTRLAGRMEDTMQAFAVRAACFIGEQDVPYSEEFDGQDFGATHLVAYLGAEPVGALRIRWFQSFAMPERLAVMQRFRGHQRRAAPARARPRAGREPRLQDPLHACIAGPGDLLREAGLAPARRRTDARRPADAWRWFARSIRPWKAPKLPIRMPLPFPPSTASIRQPRRTASDDSSPVTNKTACADA